MANLDDLAHEACKVVQDIRVNHIRVLPSTLDHLVTIDYQGYQRTIPFLYGELQTRSEDWLLDDLIAQFEKFKDVIDKDLSSGHFKPLVSVSQEAEV